jgi:hypothetical protein
MRAAALTLLPVLAMFPIVRLADFGAAGFATVWPILVFAPLSMWMETRSITMLLATCRGSRDPFLIAALPLGLTALGAYTFSAGLLAFALPALFRLF